MKIFDMHIHIWDQEPDPNVLLSNMDAAGIYGGCVMSRPPMEYDQSIGSAFDFRLQEVLTCCSFAPERLFPVLWIHPDEENITQKVKNAAEQGICAFKIICNNFYIYEQRCMDLLRVIASLDKPVLFHSGILWDGTPSSQYNRPINFESLIGITGLRFSLGHCGWPWIDECIALYGKFMNASAKNPNNAEMFLDLTPGTPEIYREELLKKLFTLGYDVEDNLLFGTDNLAHTYSTNWAKNWLNTDRRIMDAYGVSKGVRQKMHNGNLMRFLGITREAVSHNAPTTDNANAWCCQNPEVQTVIKKWFDRLNLPKEYLEEFNVALGSIPISDAIEIENYNIWEKDGKRNLLSALFMCEELSKKYAEKGIPEQILLDTLSDIKIWLNTWSEIKGELYLGEMVWLRRHLNMQIFRLGRLQFAFEQSKHDYPQYDLQKGEPVIGVHIPSGEPLTVAECEASFALARVFFKKYFPDYQYRFYTCHSWLLDPALRRILPLKSNIVQFQNRFIHLRDDDDDAILKYVFKWNTTGLNLKYAPVLSSFAEAVKSEYLAGTQFHVSLGIIKK